MSRSLSVSTKNKAFPVVKHDRSSQHDFAYTKYVGVTGLCETIDGDVRALWSKGPSYVSSMSFPMFLPMSCVPGDMTDLLVRVPSNFLDVLSVMVKHTDTLKVFTFIHN